VIEDAERDVDVGGFPHLGLIPALRA
jgi:hypothetical protein